MDSKDLKDSKQPEVEPTPVTEVVETANPAEVPETPEATHDPQTVSGPLGKFRLSRKQLIIGLVALLVMAAGVTSYFLFFKADAAPVAKKVATSTKPVVRTIQPDEVIKQDVQDIVDPDGITFLKEPAKLSGIDLFSDYGELFGYSCDNGGNNCKTPILKPSDISYVVVGYRMVDGKKQNIIAIDSNLGGDMGWTYYAVEDSKDHYQIYLEMSFDTSANMPWLDTFKRSVKPNVTINTTDRLKLATFPSTASVDNRSLKASFADTNNGYYIGDLTQVRGSYFAKTIPLSNMKKLGTVDNRVFYEIIADEKANFMLKEVYGTYAGVTAASYTVVDPLTNPDSPATIKWNDSSLDGTTNTHSYATRTPGCGSANGYAIAKNVNPDQLITAGLGQDGLTIYQLPLNHPLFQEIYEKDYAGGSYLDAADLRQLTPEQFQAQHGLLLAKNGSGEYGVYLRDDMFIGGGCGKPVVYLYPTHPMEVDIRVGANVTISEPLYNPTTGWQNVLAKTNGQLTYQGKNYGSLFWEGTGYGNYPATDSGTIVKQADLKSTIRKQLKQQGFNSTETTDFMEFWDSRLPTTPYTRLTWFNTKQMNDLAPLQLSPKPNTLIRTFLDFQGLDKPIKLKSQTFQAPERKGFTVVEWGGLLRD